MNLKFTKKEFQYLGYTLSLLLLAAAILIRFFRLEIDPPLYFAGTGQDLLTDPYNITAFARNKILFGSWDLFDYSRWIAFKYSLSSLASYVTFLIGGVSRVTANLSAVLLNLGGIGLFLLSLRSCGRRVLLSTALLLTLNMPLMVYGRYPFLENGLIFIAGLFSYLFLKYYGNRGHLLLAGLLIALAALTGKIFGIALIAAPVLVLWFADNRKSFRQIGLLFLSTGIFLAALALLFYGGRIDDLYRYISEQSVGMYGTPAPLASPLKIPEWLLTMGWQSRLFYFAPVLLMLTFVAGGAWLLRPHSAKSQLRENRTLIFNLGWLVGGFILLMLFNYRPLRYQLFLLPPLAAVISIVAFGLKSESSPRSPGIGRIVLLGILCWYFCTHAVFTLFFDLPNPDRIVWYALAPALILTIFLLRFRQPYLRMLQSRREIFIVLIALFLVHQSYLVYRWLEKASYGLKRAGTDLAQIVNPEAVLAGPYAQTLAIDTRLRTLTYMFGLKNKEPELFNSYPLTHIAADPTNWNQAVIDYPFLERSRRITKYWIRDVGIDLYLIPGAPDKSGRVPYRETPLEQAAAFADSSQYDSALTCLASFLDEYPQNKSALSLKALMFLQLQRYGDGLKTFDRAMNFYPDDFSLYFDRAVYTYQRYRATYNRALLQESERLFNKALELNPYIEKDISEAKGQADLSGP